MILEDKVVVVTGGAGGIGHAVSVGASIEGAAVVVADYGVKLNGGSPSTEAAQNVVDEILSLGGRAIAVNEDVTSMEGAKRTCEAALSTWGQLDGVVCCAGIARHIPFLDLTEDDWDAVIATHLKGHFATFHAAATTMVRLGIQGSLVGFSSGYVQGSPRRANYRAAKAGIIALVKCAAIDLAETGIRVNCISPAANTRMTEAENTMVDGDPDDIAPLSNYLLSSLSSDVNGQLFSIAGRRIACWSDPFQNRLARSGSKWTPQEIALEVPYLLGRDRVGLGLPPQ
jgi:NAD(P)-dependent dehydrogenase (short-subunit alcohol dehydrogenase family)